MTKELTPLEALERLYDYPNLHNRNIVAYLLEQENLPTYRKIIETALKDYENLKNRAKNLQKLTCEVEKDINKLKALEIIKEKGFVPKVLKQLDTVIDYNDCIRCGYYGVYAIEKEEFDLLKEVLK